LDHWTDHPQNPVGAVALPQINTSRALPGFFISTIHERKHMENISLYFKEGASDKVYQAAIEPKDGGYVVNFAYGRRGNTLTTGSKTTAPVCYDEAKCIFNKLVAEKQAKGYTPGEDGMPYRQTGRELQSTGIHCQLLNPITECEAEALIADPSWCLQEKFDGRRLLIRKEGEVVTGINRLGLSVAIPESIAASAEAIPADFIIDGEAVGDCLHVFDLLSHNGSDLRSLPYRDRYLQLMDIIISNALRGIRLVATAFMPGQKRAFMEGYRAERKEGVVFKNIEAPYTAGRPNSGGSQLKLRFTESASFIVSQINGKRSVALMLLNDGRLVPAGNVTIPPNHDVPPIGAVVECRYLYAFPESGVIYQPVYLGQREDIRAEECVVSQLKYKAPASSEEVA
jgi:bifunctional non-homologous end joining protein LigD